jgi:hypothetical protein
VTSILEKIGRFRRECLLTLALFVALYALNAYAISPILQGTAGGATALITTMGIFLISPILAGAYGGYIIAKKDAGKISLLLPGAVIAIGFLLANIPLLIMSGMMSDAEFRERWENNIKALDNDTLAIYEKDGPIEYDPKYKTDAVNWLTISLMMDIPLLFALGAAGAWASRRISTGR